MIVTTTFRQPRYQSPEKAAPYHAPVMDPWYPPKLFVLLADCRQIPIESKLFVDHLTSHEAVLRIQGGLPVTVFHIFHRGRLCHDRHAPM
jgi:hypothetical protein